MTSKIQPAIDILSRYTSRTSYIDVYDRHAKARLSTSFAFVKQMALKKPRRWKFEVYQKEQRQAKKSCGGSSWRFTSEQHLGSMGRWGLRPDFEWPRGCSQQKIARFIESPLDQPDYVGKRVR